MSEWIEDTVALFVVVVLALIVGTPLSLAATALLSDPVGRCFLGILLATFIACGIYTAIRRPVERW